MRELTKEDLGIAIRSRIKTLTETAKIYESQGFEDYAEGMRLAITLLMSLLVEYGVNEGE